MDDIWFDLSEYDGYIIQNDKLDHKNGKRIATNKLIEPSSCIHAPVRWPDGTYRIKINVRTTISYIILPTHESSKAFHVFATILRAVADFATKSAPKLEGQHEP